MPCIGFNLRSPKWLKMCTVVERERGHTEHSADRAHICIHKAVSLVDTHLPKGSGQTRLASGCSGGKGVGRGGSREM